MTAVNDVQADVAAPTSRVERSAWDALVPTMTEKQFSGHVVKAARDLGWRCYHSFLSVRSEPGFPDLVLVRGDQLLFVELKREGKGLTLAQQDWVHALSVTCAAVYAPVQPSQYDMLLEVLR